MANELPSWDSSRYLGDEADIAEYLRGCAAADDPLTMVLALGAVARARNMSALARQVGMTREGLYKALSPNGNPSFTTISKVASALGYPIVFAAGRTAPRTDRTPARRSRRKTDDLLAARRKTLALIDATVQSATRLRETLLALDAEIERS